MWSFYIVSENSDRHVSLSQSWTDKNSWFDTWHFANWTSQLHWQHGWLPIPWDDHPKNPAPRSTSASTLANTIAPPGSRSRWPASPGPRMTSSWPKMKLTNLRFDAKDIHRWRTKFQWLHNFQGGGIGPRYPSLFMKRKNDFQWSKRT